MANESSPKRAEQLSAYDVTAKLYEQIIALEGHVSKLATSYLAITGALWVAVATDKLGLSQPASYGILAFHLVASSWLGDSRHAQTWIPRVNVTCV